MIDSHCHLDHEPMYSDLKNVIYRSKDHSAQNVRNKIISLLAMGSPSQNFRRF